MRNLSGPITTDAFWIVFGRYTTSHAEPIRARSIRRRSIKARAGGSYNLVFQANTGNLWMTGATGTGDLGLGMAGGTSPATN
jgi:hypothetical protein